MPELNARQEAFCRLVVLLEPATTAYRKAYKANQKTAEACASRLMENAKIAARIKELQDLGAAKTVLSLQDANKFCLDIIQAKIGEIDERSPLCQSYKITDKSTEYKMPDKLRAAELTMKLQGKLSEKLRVEHSGDIHITVTEEKRIEILGKIRDVRLEASKRN